MNGKLADAPFALTTEGQLLVNLTHEIGIDDPNALLERALKHRGRVFIGVTLDRKEVEYVLEAIGHGWREAAASVLGARRQKRRR